MTRSEILTLEDIEELTSGYYDIYVKELGSIPSKKFPCPWRNDGKIPGFSIKKYGNTYMWKDFGGDGASGGGIQFIQRLYNLTFPQAIEKIKIDFNLLKLKKEYKKVEVRQTKIIPKGPPLIEFEDKSFDKEGAKYWADYELSESFLRQNNIFQVKKYAIDKKVAKIGSNELIFAYWAEDINKVKLLRLGEDIGKELKWRTNCPGDYLWYYHNYIGKKEVKDLFLTKSVKDLMVLKLLGYDGISLQAEDSTTFLKFNIEKVQKICCCPIINMGADPQGFQTSLTISQATGYRWFNTKKYLLKQGINDPASLVKEYSLEILDKEIKKSMKKWEKVDIK